MKRSRRWVLIAGMLLLPALGGIGCRGEEGQRSAQVPEAPESLATDGGSTVYSAATLPIPELGYNTREGRSLYRHYCLNCHGDTGQGDGFNAYNLDPRPVSMADSTFQAQHSDADLTTAIRSGGAAVGLSSGMPPWGRTLDERKIRNIVAYLRTLDEAQSSDP